MKSLYLIDFKKGTKVVRYVAAYWEVAFLRPLQLDVAKKRLPASQMVDVKAGPGKRLEERVAGIAERGSHKK